jgi:SAM-dependent methyltransferase
MLREAILPPNLTRTPEPVAVMDSSDSVAGFDREGTKGLLPIYRFNALAISRLAPAGAQLVDLGCGSGRFLAYLAKRRPDLKILGVDLAEDMVAVGRRHLVASGLDDRVRLVHGDMREFRRLLPARADIVTSVFSMHHLAAWEDLRACLGEVAAAVDGGQASLWIFDHVRPRRGRTAEEVPDIFTPDASAAFCEDSRNSLRASWSFSELGTALRAALPISGHGAQSRWLPLYQIHWASPFTRDSDGGVEWIDEQDLPRGARVEALVLSRLFGATPASPRKLWSQRPS